MGEIAPYLFGLGVKLVHGLFSRLPYAASLALGAAIGRLYAWLGAPRVDDARINLEIAFPEWTPLRRREVLLESFANHGRSLAEVCMLGGPQETEIYQNISFRGLEHLEAARAASSDGGVLVISAHLGTWELCAASLARRGLPISVVYHDLGNPVLERIVTHWREASGLETLKLGRAAYGIFSALRRGRYVGLLMDQNAKLDEGLFAPFFGREACTLQGPILLAMHRGVAIVPVFIYRQGRSGRHIIRVEPAIQIEGGVGGEVEGEGDENLGEEALLRNVTRMNEVIEAAIRRAPDQWIWSHRRYKNQPAGKEASPYPHRGGLLRSVRHAMRARRQAP